MCAVLVCVTLSVEGLKTFPVSQWIKKVAKPWEVTLLKECLSHEFYNFFSQIFKNDFTYLGESKQAQAGAEGEEQRE